LNRYYKQVELNTLGMDPLKNKIKVEF